MHRAPQTQEAYGRPSYRIFQPTQTKRMKPSPPIEPIELPPLPTIPVASSSKLPNEIGVPRRSRAPLTSQRASVPPKSIESEVASPRGLKRERVPVVQVDARKRAGLIMTNDLEGAFTHRRDEHVRRMAVGERTRIENESREEQAREGEGLREARFDREVNERDESEAISREDNARAERRWQEQYDHWQIMNAAADAARSARQSVQPPTRRVADEDVKTVARLASGCVVTFSAGLSFSPEDVITGPECCTVLVRDLPANAEQRAVRAFVAKLARGRPLAVSEVEEGDATVWGDEEVGRVLGSVGEAEFLGKTISFEMVARNELSSPETNVLTIAWRASSVHYLIKYDDTAEAERRANELDKRVFESHRLQVDVQVGTRIRIRGLPSSITDADVVALSGSPLVQRWQCGNPSTNMAARRLREELKTISPGAVASFERVTSHRRTHNELVAVRAHFTSWDNAYRVKRRLENRRVDWLGGVSFDLDLPAPYAFRIVIPKEQYDVQKTQWDALAESCRRNACALRVDGSTGVPDEVRVKVEGTEEHAVGSLKVRMAALAAGTRVEGWHPSFDANPEALRAFERAVSDSTGAMVRMDPECRQLSLFGAARAVEHAQTKIKIEIERLNRTERTIVTLEARFVRYFMRYGIALLKEVVGEDGVHFDAGSRKLAVAGGEEGRHILDHLLATSVSGGHAPQGSGPCPICLDQVSAPIQLECRHVYCTPCLRHLLMSAVDFPLVCVGDDARCGRPIPVPVFQLFLPEASFRRLLEKAFTAHVVKHPDNFTHCRTPDCAYIYRVTSSEAASSVKCPSCFSTVCSSCHEDAHALGHPCQKRERERENAERMAEEWLKQQEGRVKRCPKCGVLIEKVAGCDHVSCR